MAGKARLPLRRRILFIGLAALSCLLLCEGLLQAAAALSPRIAYHLQPHQTRIRYYDPALGYRLSPFVAAHDDRGFRNPEVPGSVDILAVGDSLTYGYATDAEHSWPRLLEKRTGLSVYNTGVGGFGPYEYEVVLRQCLDLEPRTVLLGLYMGNDISNCYRSVYVEPRTGADRYRNPDPDALALFEEWDRTRNFTKLAASLLGREPPGPPRTGLRAWLARNSALYGLVREIRLAAGGTAQGVTRSRADQKAYESAARKPFRLAWDSDPRFRTVFRNPDHDILAVDLEDPRIREGKRIAKTILLSIRDRLAGKGIRFVVVVIPNKQLAYAERIGEAMTTEFRRYVELEKRLTAETIAVLEAAGIEYVTVLDAIRARFDAGTPPYHESDDHHPNDAGYAAIAEVVAAALRRG